MKSLFFLYTLLCLTLTVSASVPRIKGKVVEAGNSTPIDYADIILIEKGKTNPVLHTLPETDGGFILSDIKDGEYSLLIRAVGFDVYTRSDIMLNTSTTVFNLGIIEMKPLEQGLAEVEIVAQKRQVIYKLDKKVIDASNSLLASGGSIKMTKLGKNMYISLT